MSKQLELKVKLNRNNCVTSLKADDLVRLADALSVPLEDHDDLKYLVRTNASVNVEFRFTADGEFAGVYAVLNGKAILLIPGATSKEVKTFKGSPTDTNPGEGWQVEPELTTKYLNQPVDENAWEIFYASRVSVLNI